MNSDSDDAVIMLQPQNGTEDAAAAAAVDNEEGKKEPAEHLREPVWDEAETLHDDLRTSSTNIAEEEGEEGDGNDHKNTTVLASSQNRRDNNNNSQGDSRRRWILLSFSFVSTSLVAGTVYGWPALRRLLLQQPGSSTTTQLTERQLGAIFTAGSWSAQGGRFAAGIARDRYGTRRVACAALAAACCGSVGLAVADTACGLAAALFVSSLGAGVQLVTQPVARLFPPRHTNAVLSSLSGAFQISGLVFLALAQWGPERRGAAFGVYAGMVAGLLVVAWFLLPPGPSFVLDDDNDNKEDKRAKPTARRSETRLSAEEDRTDSELNHPLEAGDVNPPSAISNSCGSDNNNDDKPGDTESSNSNNHDHDRPTKMEQLLSVEYLLLLAWFSILLIPLQYYVGSLGFQLEAKGDDDGFYAGLFAICYAASAVVAPAGGWVSDRLGLGLAQGLSTAAVAGSLFVLGSDRIPLRGQIAGLVLYSVGRMFVFSMYFSNIGRRFGYTNYGTLTGSGLLISAIFSLFQYILIAAAADGATKAVNWGCGAVLLCLTPYCAWLAVIERALPHAQPWERRTKSRKDAADGSTVCCRSSVLLGGSLSGSA